MKTLIVLVGLLTATILTSADNCLPSDHAGWVADSYNKIQTIRAGMTRADLLKVFEPEHGFLSSTRQKGTFIYRSCPYIKVDVVFSIKTGENVNTMNPADVINEISRPYLAEPVYD